MLRRRVILTPIDVDIRVFHDGASPCAPSCTPFTPHETDAAPLCRVTDQMSVCAGHRSASRRCIACQYARYGCIGCALRLSLRSDGCAQPTTSDRGRDTRGLAHSRQEITMSDPHKEDAAAQALDTRLTRTGKSPAYFGGTPVNAPLVRASTVLFDSVAAMRDTRARRSDERAFSYGARGTPTTFALEDAVSE